MVIDPGGKNISSGMGEMETLFHKLIAKLEEAWEEGLFVVVAAVNADPPQEASQGLERENGW